MSALPAYAILGVVVLQRGVELIYASHNAKTLKSQGGVEYGRTHYRVMVLLHASWLVVIALRIPHDPAIRWLPSLVFGVLQALRIWVIVSLGPFWTTRIITVPDAPLVRRGPYRYLRHPNYLVVAGEIAALPLVFGQRAVAVVFSLLNLMMLAWRIRTENAALAPRRSLR